MADKKKTNSKLIDWVDQSMKWLDVNILPLIALPILGILSADSISNHLSNLSAQSSLIIGIVVAAILVVKSRK